MFFFTLYSMGLRLSEGLALSVADIDTQRGRVHIRDSKGNRDRFVPLIVRRRIAAPTSHAGTAGPPGALREGHAH